MLIRFLRCLLMQLYVLFGQMPIRNLDTLLLESKAMMEDNIEKAASISRPFRLVGGESALVSANRQIWPFLVASGRRPLMMWESGMMRVVMAM